MAEKILQTRILQKVDSLENWGKSTLKIKKGELCFATVAASAGNGLEEPVVMVKIGTDEEKTFSELPWAFYAKASDVLEAAKDADKLTAFINNVIANAGIATDKAMQELAGRVTTAEGKITTAEGKITTLEGKVGANETAINGLKELVGDQNVAERIAKAIEELKLAETYAAKSLETTVANHVANEDAHVTTADKTTWNAALQAANIATGGANGTISVKGADVAVKGLGSAAFTEASAYEVAGAASAAETAAKTYAKEYADGLAGNYDAKGSAAAAQAAAEAYADGLAKNYDAAGAAGQALVDAKDYTDAEILEWVGDKTVTAQIAALDLANTYDAKGAAAQALTDAKAHANGLNTAMNARVEALEAIDHDHANKAELAKIADGDVAKWNAAEQNAKNYADGLDQAMDLRVDALEAKFGAGEGSVADQIADAVAAEAEERETADTALGNRIKAVEDDYLKTADKTELQGAIDALEDLVGDTKVSVAIEAAVKEEKERAEGIEGGLRTDVDAIKADYLKAADKQALQTQINTIMSNPDAEGAINSINEFTQYVKDHGTIAEGMRTDINANAADIAAIAEDYLVEADKTELQGNIDGVAGRMTTAEGKITALETASATHATKTEVSAVDGKVDAAVGRIATLEGEMDAVEGRAQALETKVGDETVANQIKAAVDPVSAKVTTLEDKAHTHANAEELAKFVAGDKVKLDAAVQTVTAGAGLTATKTGTDVAIAFDETITFVFNCGGADVE